MPTLTSLRSRRSRSGLRLRLGLPGPVGRAHLSRVARHLVRVPEATFHRVLLGRVGLRGPLTVFPPPEPQPRAIPQPEGALHQYALRPHPVRNANHVRQAERAEAGFNTRAAVWLTRHVGTMRTAYLFAAIGIGSLVGVFTNNALLAALLGSLSSYFLQLVLLPILSVGQNVLSHHQELQADEMYRATMNTLHDGEQIALHLSAQDTAILSGNAELLKQTQMLEQLLQALPASLAGVPATPAIVRPSTARPATKARARRTS